MLRRAGAGAEKPRLVKINHDVLAVDAARDPQTHAEPTIAPARWYLFKVQLGQERVAAAHLAARRFGVYVPEISVLERAGRGRRREVRRSLFPGKILVFMWDTGEQFQRVRACPGVVDVETFASCPVVLPDRVVAWIQLIETELDGYKGSRKRKGWRKKALDVGDAHEPLTIRTRDALRDYDELDAAGIAKLFSELLAPLKKSVRRGC